MSRRHRYGSDAALLTDYAEILSRRDQLEPEKKLMAAILEDALWHFRKNVLGRTQRERDLFKEAEDWILREGSHQLYSFDSICLHLDIDCACLRRRLMGWKSTAIQDPARVAAMDSCSYGKRKRKAS